jgi:uncharacterized protein (TIGR02466 family)
MYNIDNIDLWFPTPIYYADDILDENEINALINRSYDIKNNVKNGKEAWRCDVYTTFQTYDVTKDNEFSNLISKISLHVNEFAKSFGSNYKYKCDEGWINIYDNNQYQEFHYHPGYTFSAVYYLSAPEGSGKLIFNSPLHPDMMPIKNITDEKNNHMALEACEYKAIKNRLIIFRSNVQHMVQRGTNQSDRISLSFNF